MTYRDDIFGKAKRRSAGEEGKNEHVREDEKIYIFNF